MVKADILPDPRLVLRAQAPVILLTMLVWGEARGEPQDGKVAVAWVVRNRVNKPRWWGRSWKGVMLHRNPQATLYQFSCFNPNGPNLKKLMNPLKHDSGETWIACYAAAVGVYCDILGDPTNGATHYFSVDIRPSWADSMEHEGTIGRHEFYREE